MKKQLFIKILIAFLVVVASASTVTTIYVLVSKDKPLTPDYKAPELEENVEKIDGDDTKIDAPSGGGGIHIEYTNSVTIDLTNKTVELNYTHSASSTHNIVLQLRIQDQVFMQSGTILPGHKVTKLNLLNDAEKKLLPGGYNGELVILTYNPESGEKTMIDTKAQVSVTVKK